MILLAAHVFFVLAGRLFDATSESYRQNVAIRIEDARVAAVGAQIPPGAEVIDLSKYTVLPGLIDCHVHLDSRSDHFEEIWKFRESLPQRSTVVHARNTLLAASLMLCVPWAWAAILLPGRRRLRRRLHPRPRRGPAHPQGVRREGARHRPAAARELGQGGEGRRARPRAGALRDEGRRGGQGRALNGYFELASICSAFACPFTIW
jgi:hypothetical protein